MAKVKTAIQENPKAKAGGEIIPEIADALAAEAERGYDPSKAKRRRARRLGAFGDR
jgi:hypothetical protein